MDDLAILKTNNQKELVMKLRKNLPIIAIATGLVSLVATGQASASGCGDKKLHAEKLTLQAERYQNRAAELRPGEHDNYIRALKRRANNMRAKAMDLIRSCSSPAPSQHHSHHIHFHY